MCFKEKQCHDQFSRGENGLESIFSRIGLLWIQQDGVGAPRKLCYYLHSPHQFSRCLVEMEPLPQLCVINRGRNLRGKLC